ncbi:glycine cleavage system T protein [Candidatus Gastranaerophilus sp. (ex Termes propinquus)]|nr:glycine cleavage system T protein [Candidatus Gastranaerophilus sp. (ex Termes propinquus)]
MGRKTALYNEHLKLGAKMTTFSGWDMPVSYPSGILEEHKAVRERAGLFDVSHMGEFFISGEEALEYLQYLLPQDISKLEAGGALYCQLLNEKGGIIDDLLLYNLGAEYLLIVNASKVEEDFSWLEKNVGNFKVKLENVSEKYSLLSVQGPLAFKVIKKIGLSDVQKFMTTTHQEFMGHKVWLSRSGYTGEDGFEIMIENKGAPALWEEILKSGEQENIKPVGLGARDTLRLEAGLLLNGSDMDENTTPYEAGIGWSISKNKEGEFIGKEKLKHTAKKLIALEIAERGGVARQGHEIFLNNAKIGTITSGTVSPTLGKNIALGYVTFLNTDTLDVGTQVQIMIRNKLYNAKMVKKPFIKKR